MLSKFFSRSSLGLLAAAALLLPQSALAVPINVAWTSNNAVGPNTVALTVRLACSGILCSLVGFGSPYLQTQTSNLTGAGTGTLDDTTDAITLGTFGATGSNVTFTGIPVFGNVAASNIAVTLLSAASGTIPGWDLIQNAQSIATSLNGGQWQATATTNNTTIPTIAVGPLVINAPGTLVEVGTSGLGEPLFELRNLRGAFDFLTATSISGVTIRSTFRATFTLNLSGVGPVIPEPGTFALLGLGILGFGAAAARRRSS